MGKGHQSDGGAQGHRKQDAPVQRVDRVEDDQFIVAHQDQHEGAGDARQDHAADRHDAADYKIPEGIVLRRRAQKRYGGGYGGSQNKHQDHGRRPAADGLSDKKDGSKNESEKIRPDEDGVMVEQKPEQPGQRQDARSRTRKDGQQKKEVGAPGKGPPPAPKK